ncbi:MAG: 4Fe-4S binding protein [Armatimonadetes bacterium]|nr:4Fe-4S binding protein [Armatimonadota bacterium]
MSGFLGRRPETWGRKGCVRDEVAGVSKTRPRITVEVDETICKGCGLCVDFCPRQAMGFAVHINARGFHPAQLQHPDKCTGCAQCAVMCPDACIRIVREK